MNILHDGSPAASEVSQSLAIHLGGEGSLALSPSLIPAEVEGLPSSGHCVFVVHASADGSIERVLRKLSKSLKAAPPDALKAEFMCLLLGGARCSNSAQSTRDDVYRSGRKLVSLLSAAGAVKAAVLGKGGEELDVELDDVEAAVVKWSDAIKAWVGDNNNINNNDDDGVFPLPPPQPSPPVDPVTGLPSSFDYVIIGSSLSLYVLSASLAYAGRTVLHLVSKPYYTVSSLSEFEVRGAKDERGWEERSEEVQQIIIFTEHCPMS